MAEVDGCPVPLASHCQSMTTIFLSKNQTAATLELAKKIRTDCVGMTSAVLVSIPLELLEALTHFPARPNLKDSPVQHLLSVGA